MSKTLNRTASGRFVVGRQSAEKFSAVEGLRRNARTGRLLSDSDALKESSTQLRERVRTEFVRKK